MFRTPALCLLALAAVGPGPPGAAAQVPLPPLPPGVGPSPPSEDPAPEPAPPAEPPPNDGARRPPDAQAGGEVRSYYGNPAHTNANPGRPVFGPLYLAWKKELYDRPYNHPLIADGMVVTTRYTTSSGGYASHLIAYRAVTGRRVWERKVPGLYWHVDIAIDTRRVIATNLDGVVRAYGLARGKPLWRRNLGGESADRRVPVAAGGVVYVGGAELAALRVSNGEVLWRADTGFPYGVPTLDGARVFLTSACGGAIAVSRSRGEVLWRRRGAPRCGVAAGPTSIVKSGRLYAGNGRTYNSITGARMRDVRPRHILALAGGRAFGLDRAHRIRDRRLLWRFRDPGPVGFGAEPHPPVVVGEVVYITGPSRRVYGLDVRTGHAVSSNPLPEATYNSHGNPFPGIAAGGGVLAVTQGGSLNVFRSVLAPKPRGLDVATSGPAVFAGLRAGIAAGVGVRIYRRRPRVALRLDPYPYRGFSPFARQRTVANGTAYFRPRIRRNTRARVTTGTRARAFILYAVPRIRSRIVARGPGSFELRARLTGVPRLAGRRFYLYLGRQRAQRYSRLGSATLVRAGTRRARAVVRFRRPRRVGRRDIFVFCVGSLPRGYGVRDRFQRRCGARSFRY